MRVFFWGDFSKLFFGGVPCLRVWEISDYNLEVLR